MTRLIQAVGRALALAAILAPVGLHAQAGEKPAAKPAQTIAAPPKIEVPAAPPAPDYGVSVEEISMRFASCDVQREKAAARIRALEEHIKRLEEVIARLQPPAQTQPAAGEKPK